MAVVIEGGSLQHRRLLHAIFERFGPTVIRRVVLGRHLVRPVLGGLPTLEDPQRASGVSFQVIEAAAPKLRVHWEAGLIARAFRAAAHDKGLEQVAIVQAPSGGWALGRWTRGPAPPLPARDVQQLLDDVEGAALAAQAEVVCIDLVRPSGHGVALQLRVAEPHDFLRYRFTGFQGEIAPWRERCGNQVYLELLDDRAEPVLVTASDGNGGGGRLRPDLECCHSLVTIGRPLWARPAPKCPVFG